MGREEDDEGDLPAVGDVVADKYELTEALGDGGMGVVFGARHVVTGREVAIKWMLPSYANDLVARARFVREARASARIDHPNVVAIHDVCEHEDAPFLVMERLYGHPLSDLAGQPMCAADAVAVLIPTLRGLAAAHAEGILHRDLKPGNLFLCESKDGAPREPKVLDFGISKIESKDERPELTLTRTGAVMGTPLYMSPEHLRGKRDLDARTDVYAMGVVLYELLTGFLPFEAPTFSALVVEIVDGQPRPPSELAPEISPELEEVVLKAMAVRPEDRFETAEAFGRALEPFGDGAKFDDSSTRVSFPQLAAGRVRSRPDWSLADSSADTVLASEESERDEVFEEAASPGTTPSSPPAATPSRVDANSSATLALPISRAPMVLGVGALALVGLVGGGIWMSSGSPSDPAPVSDDVEPTTMDRSPDEELAGNEEGETVERPPASTVGEADPADEASAIPDGVDPGEPAEEAEPTDEVNQGDERPPTGRRVTSPRRDPAADRPRGDPEPDEPPTPGRTGPVRPEDFL